MMVITETNPGMVALDTACSMAKTIQTLDFMKAMQTMHDAASRDLAVNEMQSQLLAAKAAQAALIETVSALRKELAELTKGVPNRERCGATLA